MYNGFYTEISNVFSNKSSIKNGFTFPPITADPKKYNYCIKYDLLQNLVNDKPLKAYKRLYTLAIGENDQRTLNELYPVLTSNIAILNKVNSIIKTHITLIEAHGDKYIDEIKKQLNNLKPLLSFIYEFRFNEKHFDYLLDHTISLNVLEKISEDFETIIRNQTLKYKIKISRKYLL
jgi:hypothetical protein